MRRLNFAVLRRQADLRFGLIRVRDEAESIAFYQGERDEDAEETDTSDAEGDAMYDAAVRIVADTRRCSTSWIQRKLGVGYNRAAKIVGRQQRHQRAVGSNEQYAETGQPE